MSADGTMPLVSVIVPVFNHAAALARLLQALNEQNCPVERFECLVIDNASTEAIRLPEGLRFGLRLVREERRGSYAARNRGIQEARGDVFAFTDADCLPRPDWLSSAVARLQGADHLLMVGGKVEIYCPHGGPPSIVEWHSIVNEFPQERFTNDRFVITANLITTRAVFQRVGLFDTEFLSGGDVEWGRRAWSAGVQQTYAEDAVVRHSARATWGELARKMRRITGGHYTLMGRGPRPVSAMVRSIARISAAAIARTWRDPRVPTLRCRLSLVALDLLIRFVQLVELVRLWLGGQPRRQRDRFRGRPLMNPARPTVVSFCMPGVGHFHAQRPVIARLAQSGLTVFVLTHRDYRNQVERAGGQFIDLFAKYPIEAADGESKPIPCRYVSFAGHFAERVLNDVRRLQPSLIIHDAQAVIGVVVARALNLPHVCVLANHNLNPARYLATLAGDPRVAVSEQCHQAVEKLRCQFGLRDASPFWYVTALSPYLNLYCEPPQFLEPPDRAPFEPIAFFGCLLELPRHPGELRERDAWLFAPRTESLRVYVSFGTVVWWYFAADALAAVQAIAASCERTEDVEVLVSLGGADVAPELTAPLQAARVRVVPYVDQFAELARADVFVTHHGLNSTHEAIARRVAMVSYPFFGDQPTLARKCQELGLAIPLTAGARDPVTPADMTVALLNVNANRKNMRARLDQAYAWEQETMERRDRVVRQILDLTS